MSTDQPAPIPAMPAAPLTPAAASLKFHRDRYIPGGLEARVETARTVRYSDGRPMYDVTDTVTFRVVPAEEFDEDKGRTVRYGWRCLVFANAQVIYDDRGRGCDKLGLAKAYLRRLADDPMTAHSAFMALCDEHFYKEFDYHHDAYMAAISDFYGAADRAR